MQPVDNGSHATELINNANLGRNFNYFIVHSIILFTKQWKRLIFTKGEYSDSKKINNSAIIFNVLIAKFYLNFKQDDKNF